MTSFFHEKKCDPLNTAHKSTVISNLGWDSLEIKGKQEDEEEKLNAVICWYRNTVLLCVLSS